MNKYYFVTYVWRILGDTTWEYANKAIDKEPWFWINDYLKRNETRNRKMEAALIFNNEIPQEDYEKLKNEL